MAELFEAYVGAIARELGTEQFGKLHAWYYNLIEPYVEHYHKAYQNRNTAGIPTPTISSSESKLRRQNVAAYTSRLMEYAAKNKLEPPKFEFKDNGLQGAGIQWEATVSLGGAAVARATATTKLEAKHLASREALGALRDPAALDPRAGVTGGGQDRRRRKMERRMRGGAHGMQTPAVPHQQPLPSPWVQPPHIIPQIPSMPMQYPQHALPQITMATHQPMMNVYGQPTLPPHPPPGIM